MNAIDPRPLPERPDPEDPDRSDSEPEQADPARAAIVLVVIAVLTIGSYFLIAKLREMGHLQDCLMQGRTNCAPLDVK